MRLYRYIKINNPPDEDFDYDITDQYVSYAFTCDKKIAKRFEEERNMKRFIKKVSKVSKEEYCEYAKRHRIEELKLRKLDTSFKESPTGIVTIVMTMQEYTSCDAEAVCIAPYDDSYWTDEFHYPPEVYNKKVRKALELLGYTAFYNIYFRGDCDVEIPSFRVDIYNYFLEMYSDTFL